MLSERLNMVADMVAKCGVMADIGTDHGYIPIYLVKNNIVRSAVAADISQGSCNKARVNIDLSGLGDKIDVRCGNGLEVIAKGEKVNAIVIAGMGGLMAISVLESNKEAVENACQLVIQPQRDIDKVRRYLHSIGYYIEDENMLREKDKFYTAISAFKGNEKYNDIEYMLGKKLIEKKSSALKEYAEYENNKVLNILKNMEERDMNESEAYNKMYSLHSMYEEVIKCL